MSKIPKSQLSGQKITSPNSWTKYGEIYTDESFRMIFVCSACQENGSNTQEEEGGYLCFDVMSFWEHIEEKHSTKQHSPPVGAELVRKTGNDLETIVIDGDVECADQHVSNAKNAVTTQENTIHEVIQIDSDNDDDDEEDYVKMITKELSDLHKNDTHSTNRAASRTSGEQEESQHTPLLLDDHFSAYNTHCDPIAIQRNMQSNHNSCIAPVYSAPPMPIPTGPSAAEENAGNLLVPLRDPEKRRNKHKTSKQSGSRGIASNSSSSRFDGILAIDDLKCKLCGRRTRNQQSFIKHQLRYHSAGCGQFHLNCEICYQLVLKTEFKQHQLTHCKLTLFKCSECNVNYKRRYYLYIHYARVHHRMEYLTNLYAVEEPPLLPTPPPATPPHLEPPLQQYIYDPRLSGSFAASLLDYSHSHSHF